MNKDVHVIDRDTLDHPEQFAKPWLVQFEDGEILLFDTEDEACQFQIEHRSRNGLDIYTGEPM